MFIVVVNIGDVVVDIQELKQFESVYQPSKEIAFCWSVKKYVQLCLEQDHTDIVDHANDSLRIWQAAKAQAVPEGFVVVPKEPTKEMRVNGAVAWCRNEGVHDIYKAMIESALKQFSKQINISKRI